MSYTWAPQVSDVALIVPRLTNDATRTFDSMTFPTDVQVTSVIASVCAEVAVLAGDPDLLSDQATDAASTSAFVTLKGMATRCAVLGAAAEIERNYMRDANSRYARDEFLANQYDAALTALRQGTAEFNRGQKMGGVNDDAPVLTSFPPIQSYDVAPGLINDPDTNTLALDPYWDMF